jgi:putative transposase
MPRSNRVAPPGIVFHVLNRGNDRRQIFDDDADYAAFERVLTESLVLEPVRLLAYCVMPNHWHMLLEPTAEGQLGRFMQRLTVTHVRRWHEHRHSVGHGHLYQGTFKSFPVQDDMHFAAVARYVERNALRAGLVGLAQAWQWASLWRREHGSPEQRMILSEWPIARPADWVTKVNRAQSAKEEEAIRQSLRRGRPFGDGTWQLKTAKALGLESTFRERGRPKKAK